MKCTLCFRWSRSQRSACGTGIPRFQLQPRVQSVRFSHRSSRGIPQYCPRGINMSESHDESELRRHFALARLKPGEVEAFFQQTRDDGRPIDVPVTFALAVRRYFARLSRQAGHIEDIFSIRAHRATREKSGCARIIWTGRLPESMSVHEDRFALTCQNGPGSGDDYAGVFETCGAEFRCDGSSISRSYRCLEHGGISPPLSFGARQRQRRSA